MLVRLSHTTAAARACMAASTSASDTWRRQACWTEYRASAPLVTRNAVVSGLPVPGLLGQRSSSIDTT